MDLLYVVMTNPPGPGARALLQMELNSLAADGKSVPDIQNRLFDAVDGACEFVELEDAAGKGRGDSSGIDWSDHPSGDLRRLGPFVSAAQLKGALDDIRAIATDHYHGGEQERIEQIEGILDELQGEIGVPA